MSGVPGVAAAMAADAALAAQLGVPGGGAAVHGHRRSHRPERPAAVHAGSSHGRVAGGTGPATRDPAHPVRRRRPSSPGRRRRAGRRAARGPRPRCRRSRSTRSPPMRSRAAASPPCATPRATTSPCRCPSWSGARTTVAGIAARVPDDARALMDAFWPGSLTLLLAPQPTLAWDLAGRRPARHPHAAASGGARAAGAERPAGRDDGEPARACPRRSTSTTPSTQLGDAIGLALDAGDLSGDEPLPSTVVDVTGDRPRVVRIGAISVEQLRRVCPHVLADEGSATA